MNKEHIMTNEEKEKFLKRVKFETEDISASKDPKDEFITKLDAYQQSMEKQIEEVDKLIKVQEYLLKTTQDVLDKNINGLSEEVLKTEITTKQQVIMQASASKVLMQERIRLGTALKQQVIDNYDFLNDLDFYFNGALNMPELESRRNAILNKDKTDNNVN